MINKVIKRETVKVVETFTNGFAQEVIKLENGLHLYISYDRSQVEIVTVDTKEMTPQEVTNLINATPEEQ